MKWIQQQKMAIIIIIIIIKIIINTYETISVEPEKEPEKYKYSTNNPQHCKMTQGTGNEWDTQWVFNMSLQFKYVLR